MSGNHSDPTLYNWIVILGRNNLHLTRAAMKTLQAQDIGNVVVLLVDNASTDGTAEWSNTLKDVFRMHFQEQVSVAKAWNSALEFVLGKAYAQHCLVVNNDVELRPDTYRHLVADGGGFVTAVGNRDPKSIKQELDPEQVHHKRPHPDFSCYLIRREVYQQVGPFDEKFEIAFCEDWDYHVRLQKAGIRAECLDLPFYHVGSGTVKNADPGEIRRIQVQAERNREYFYKKWGFRGASDEYYQFFNNDPPPPPTD